MSDGRRLDRAVEFFHELEALKTDEPQIASAWDRLMARAVDLGFAVAVLATIAFFGWVASALIWGNREREEYLNPGAGEIAFNVALGLLWLGTVVFNEVVGFSRGERQTVGKRSLGIRVVVAETGDVPGSGRMLARWLTVILIEGVIVAVWALAASLMPVGLAFVIMLVVFASTVVFVVGQDGQALHDRIWATRLIRPR